MKISTKKLIARLKKNKIYTQCIPFKVPNENNEMNTPCNICDRWFSVNSLFNTTQNQFICYNCIDQILNKVLTSTQQ